MKQGKRDALTSLNDATMEYEQVQAELIKTYENYDETVDSAIILVSNVETLVESIRHRPLSYSKVKRKISVQKANFVKSKEILRKERTKNITAGIIAGTVAGGGLTFGAFMKKKCKNNILYWLLCLVFLVVVVVAFLMVKLFNGIATSKDAYKQAKLAKEAVRKNQILLEQSINQIKKIRAEMDATTNYYEQLKIFAGGNYHTFKEETKSALGTLYNLALTLTELVNEKIG